MISGGDDEVATQCLARYRRLDVVLLSRPQTNYDNVLTISWPCYRAMLSLNSIFVILPAFGLSSAFTLRWAKHSDTCRCWNDSLKIIDKEKIDKIDFVSFASESITILLCKMVQCDVWVALPQKWVIYRFFWLSLCKPAKWITVKFKSPNNVIRRFHRHFYAFSIQRQLIGLKCWIIVIWT